MFKNSDEVLKFISDEGVKFVDVRFSDLPGVMQHFTLPAKAFDADAIEEGLAFDGSSVRGFQSIHESDMLLLPDLYTARLDPFRIEKTLIVNFFVHDPFTREAYSRDPRNIARKAEQYITDSGIAACYDATSGKMRWMRRLGGKFWASPVYADGRIYCIDEAGTTHVLAPGGAYEELATNKLDETIDASPAIVGNEMFIRGEKHLYCISEK